MAMAVYQYPPVEMPPHVYSHRRASCPNPHKDWFATEFEAMQVSDHINTRKRKSHCKRTPQAAYPCRCGGWHLSDARRVEVMGRAS
ncbi:hypothetical protein SEA_NANOSMITE_143 [Mycobacterium phage Nanosmite]|nr:hypothetical protein SEA_NANOSMITE_143 [Mycobacterium phage Nanosmite]